MNKPSAAFAPVPGYSRTKIDRAGVLLRDWWGSNSDPDDWDALLDAFRAMITFREAFQMPLNKTVMGLRSMVVSEWPELREQSDSIPVVQRLKRREQILSKLHRMPDMRLSNMGDIGGCRAVLDNRERVDAVLRRIRRRWHVHGDVRDTRDDPAPSGYRAVHVIVVRDGRRVEVQLRAPHEHDWALAVERTGQRLSIPLKEGHGPADLREYFRLASHGMYVDSLGGSPDTRFLAEFRAAREAVRPYFAR